jgi:hypothetical protein
MQHGVRLGKRNSNPIQKVVNPVGTVITVSVPSEELAAAQTSDFSMTKPSEIESSAEEESGLKPVHGCSRKDPPSLEDTVRWPAVSKPTCFSQCKKYYEPTVYENKEVELRTKEKGKGKTQSVSSERCSNELQDERNDNNKWHGVEDKKGRNATVGETEHKDITVPWRSHVMDSGPFALCASVWEKGKAEGIDPQFKPQKSLSGVEDVNVKEGIKDESNKEDEVKMVRSKMQISLDRNNASCKTKSCLAKGMYIDYPSGPGSLRRGKMSRCDEDTLSERTFNMDEVKYSEMKGSKQNTKKKTSGITSGSIEGKKLSIGDKHHICLEEERNDDISVPKVGLMNVVSASDAPNTEDDKERTQKLVEFDDPCPSRAHGIIKKIKMKSKDPQSLLLEDNEFIDNPDSGDNTDSDKLGNSSVSLPKIEPLKLCSSLVHEYHFGTGRNSSHDAIRNTNFESLSRNSESGTESSQLMQSITEERTRNRTRESSEKKSCRVSTDLETGGDRSKQKNPMFRSALDDDLVSPVQSWSSIVSSSNINRSPLREIVVQASSETVLLNLEELRISPQRSWSDVARGFPDHGQTEETSVTNFCGGSETVKEPKDVVDCSDGDDKMTVDSRKSQSSDQTCKILMTNKSLRTTAISETGDSAAGNAEDFSQLNEENNGNDEQADNGEATSVTSLQGANKKSRKIKKKRR